MSEQSKSKEDLDELVHEACSEIATSINNSGEVEQREFLKTGLPAGGGEQMENANELLMAIAYLEKGYAEVVSVLNNMRGTTELPTDVSPDLAQVLVSPLKVNYSTLEVRILSKAIKELGLGEWYHELMEMVCFPDIDDVVHILNNLKEHLNDKRVEFLKAEDDKAPSEGASGSSQESDDR